MRGVPSASVRSSRVVVRSRRTFFATCPPVKSARAANVVSPCRVNSGANARLTVRRPPSQPSNAKLFTQHLFEQLARLAGVFLHRHLLGLVPAGGRHDGPLRRAEREMPVDPLGNLF